MGPRIYLTGGVRTELELAAEGSDDDERSASADPCRRCLHSCPGNAGTCIRQSTKRALRPARAKRVRFIAAHEVHGSRIRCAGAKGCPRPTRTRKLSRNGPVRANISVSAGLWRRRRISSDRLPSQRSSRVCPVGRNTTTTRILAESQRPS